MNFNDLEKMIKNIRFEKTMNFNDLVKKTTINKFVECEDGSITKDTIKDICSEDKSFFGSLDSDLKSGTHSVVKDTIKVICPTCKGTCLVRVHIDNIPELLL